MSQKLALEIKSYQSSSDKEISKNKINNFFKQNPLISYKNKKQNNYSKKNFRKKEYIISIDNVFNKIKEKVKSKQSKIFNQTKFTEMSTNKNSSKEKTLNNTFNTNNTYSNYNNNINQNSNSNNTYINVAINNITEDDFTKSEEKIERIDEIKTINNKHDINNQNKNTKNIKIKTINDFYINNINSNLDNEKKEFKTQYEYYSTDDKIAEMNKKRKELFLSSRKFYLYNKEKNILSKIRQYKKEIVNKDLKQLGYDLNDNKKLILYSELKRLPTQICFGKGVSSMKKEEEDKEIYEKTFLKNLESKNKENQKNSDNFHKLMTKGFSSNKNINKYDAVLENKLVKNSNSMKKYNKKNQIISGHNLYPLLKEKKILKNILPKEIDYNTQFTIIDVINDELHPLYRYQKKNLNFHSGLISHEIDFLFVKHFALGQMADRKKDIFNKKLDEKFNILVKNLKEKNKEWKLTQKRLSDRESLKILRKQYLLQKFEKTIKRSFYYFRRMKISINLFFQMTLNTPPIKYDEGLYLFKAIKDADIENIEYLIKKNYNYALFRDEFGQTAFHICAKRNIYQIVQLLISRLGDINAKDIYGRTPLMCAAENGHLEMICVLLFKFADPDISDNKGKKAIDYVNINKKLNNLEEYKIQRALSFTRIVQLFDRIMVNEKDFDKFIGNSLKYLFKEELSINYEELLKSNDFVMKDDDKKYRKF